MKGSGNASRQAARRGKTRSGERKVMELSEQKSLSSREEKGSHSGHSLSETCMVTTSAKAAGMGRRSGRRPRLRAALRLLRRQSMTNTAQHSQTFSMRSLFACLRSI